MNVYLIFHSLAELFSIVIAWGILMVALNSRRFLKHSFFVFLGVACAAVGVIDLIHTLAYKGMGFFGQFTANLPTQLWIAGRYLNAVSLLLAPAFLMRRIRLRWIILPFAAVLAALLASVFSGVFPDCYRPDTGLTPFKVASEYLFCILIAGAMVLLRQRRVYLDRTVLRLLLFSLGLTIATELAFTLYADVYGFSNMLGHLLKLAAFGCLYRAIVVFGLQRPYQILFNDLNRSERCYRNLVSSSPDAILVAAEGRLLFANAAAMGMFQSPDLETLSARHVMDLIAPEDRAVVEDRIRRTLDRQEMAVQEVQILRPDGIRLPAEVRFSRTQYGQENNAIQMILRDLSQRIRDEKILQQHSEEMRKSRAAALNLLQDAILARRQADEANEKLSREIAERKQAEEALRRSQEDLAHAQAVGNIGSWRLDVRKNELTWSDENHRIFGIPKGTSMTYQTFLSTLHPEDLGYVDSKWKAALDGEDYDIQHRIVVNGQIKWVREKAYLEFDDSGQLVGGFGITQDITRHKKAEEAVKAAAIATFNEKMRLEAVMATLPVGVAILDEHGGNVKSNQAFEIIWGGPRPAAKNIDDYAAYKVWWCQTGKPVEPGQWASAIAVQKGQTVVGQELEIERFDGTRAFIHNSAAPIRDTDGNIVGCAAAVLDITELKRTEAALRQSEQMYRSIGETIDYGVWVCAPDGRNIYTSESFLKMVGITQQQCSDFGWGNVLHPDDAERTIAAWKECARTGGTWDIEHRFRGVDGQWHAVLARGIPIRNEQGDITCWAGINLDISRLKQAEQELRTAHDELETRVKQRTAELAHTVELLEEEVRQRRAAENAIKIERQRFEDVLEMMPAYAILLKPDHRIAYANRTFCRCFGRPDGKRCYEFLFNRTEPCENCGTFTALKSNAPHFWEWTGPNGRHYDIFDYPFMDADGSPLIMEIGVDVTAHKQQQQALQLSEKRLLEAQRVAHLGNWEWDIASGRLWWSDEVYRIFGFGMHPGALSFDVFLNVVHPDDRSRIQQAVKESLDRREPYSIDHRIIRSDGVECVVHEQGEVVCDADQQPIRMIGTVHDITERVRAEESVRQSEERFRLMAQATEDVFWMSTPGLGQMLYISPAYEKLWGRTRASLYENPKSFLEAVHPEDRDRLIAGVKGHAEGVWNFEYRILCPDGEVHWVHDIGYPVWNDRGELTMMAGMVRDITTQKKTELEILQKQMELRSLTSQLQMAEERERRRIAQDLHDSIGQILSFSGRELKMIRKSVPDSVAEQLAKIADQLDSAVQQVRTLSFDLSPGVLYDLGLEVALEDLADQMSRERKLKCTFESCASPKPLTDDIKVLLYRSVRELLINAAKHAGAESVEISCLRSGSDIYIRVQDNGCGFDPSLLENRTGSAKGFGLFNLRERLNHIGGSLKIESIEGKGTTAYLIAPLDCDLNLHGDKL